VNKKRRIEALLNDGRDYLTIHGSLVKTYIRFANMSHVWFIVFVACFAAAAADAEESLSPKVSVAFIYADFVEAAGAAAPFWHDWGFQKAMKLLSRAFDVTWFNIADAQRERVLMKRLSGKNRPDVVWSKGCWNGHAHQFMMQVRAAGLITPQTPTIIFPACSR
jgi:hypothetical protein